MSPHSQHFIREFRTALSRFATGITVVTTVNDDGQPVGITINSFNSVSLEPPLVVWSLGLGTKVRPVFEACRHYAVNVLAENQKHLSDRFASRDPNKFAGLDFTTGIDGAPLLDGCCARFECRNTARHAGGDHLVFISEVVRFGSSDQPPLIFHAGDYCRLAGRG